MRRWGLSRKVMPDPYALYTPMGDRLLVLDSTGRRRVEAWLQWIEHLQRARLWR